MDNWKFGARPKIIRLDQWGNVITQKYIGLPEHSVSVFRRYLLHWVLTIWGAHVLLVIYSYLSPINRKITINTPRISGFNRVSVQPIRNLKFYKNTFPTNVRNEKLSTNGK